MNLTYFLGLRRSLLRTAALLLASTGHAQGSAAAPRVKLATSAGDIVIELYPDKAPRTVENFLQYVKDRHYDGTVFHRVIGSFMIQGGGFDTNYRQKPTRAPIRNEAEGAVKAGLKNEIGTAAMARTSDPNSATAQFFINVADNAFLNWGDPRGDGNGYAVFGKVVAGMDVVTKIAHAPTGAGGPFPRDVPRQQVVIESVTVVGAK